MGSHTTWIEPPEFDIGDDYHDVYDNGMHLQAWLSLPNGVTLEAQFVALPPDYEMFDHESERDDFARTRECHAQVREDVSACAHYVRIKGKPYLYTLTCWAAPAPQRIKKRK